MHNVNNYPGVQELTAIIRSVVTKNGEYDGLRLNGFEAMQRIIDWHAAELSRVRYECEKIVEGLKCSKNVFASPLQQSIVSLFNNKIIAAIDKIRAL